MIHGEDVVLNVVVDIIKIAEITSVERKSYCGMYRSILLIDTAPQMCPAPHRI